MATEAEVGELLHQRGWRMAFTVAERVNAWAVLVSVIERGYGDDISVYVIQRGSGCGSIDWWKSPIGNRAERTCRGVRPRSGSVCRCPRITSASPRPSAGGCSPISSRSFPSLLGAPSISPPPGRASAPTLRPRGTTRCTRHTGSTDLVGRVSSRGDSARSSASITGSPTGRWRRSGPS
ncbi:hypothetical protein DY245_01930 [Streptomyces inhibens]|uniref:Uncharacterized protein n=1 Tax=Streptomyces inhibens TaxID=2293571 RepID=A0A371QAU3_STRIH|nr:hypothetical protein DY245_01930 [Streptomyces inhibens]